MKKHQKRRAADPKHLTAYATLLVRRRDEELALLKRQIAELQEEQIEHARRRAFEERILAMIADVKRAIVSDAIAAKHENNRYREILTRVAKR